MPFQGWTGAGCCGSILLDQLIRLLPIQNLKEVISMAYTINDDCINCGACDASCPTNAISEKGDARVIDAAACIDCAACVDTCPVNAIDAA
jgi:NAD-dependent dihydropyrimidine dehydrogenase PreA subunit